MHTLQFNLLEKQSTGSGCASVLSCFSQVQLFATLWTIVPQALLPMGFSRQEYWSGLPCPPPGDLPNPGTEPESPLSPALQAVSLLLSHQGNPTGNISSVQLLSCVRLFVTPWTIQSMEFSRPEYWSWVAFPFCRGSFQPRDRTQVSCIAGGFFTS